MSWAGDRASVAAALITHNFLKLQAIPQIRSPQCGDLWVVILPLFLTLPIPSPLEQRPQPVGHSPFGKSLTPKTFTLRFMKVAKLQ